MKKRLFLYFAGVLVLGSTGIGVVQQSTVAQQSTIPVGVWQKAQTT